MSAHDRISALYGPHARLHRHRRTVTARPSKESRPMKPTSKQIVKGGQGRDGAEHIASAEALIVLAMSVGVVALVVACGWVVEVLR